MNIDDLKEKAEDVTPVEEQKEPELTEEQKAAYEKFMRSNILRRFKSALRLLYERMKKQHSTIADIKQQILRKDKTIPFSASQRDFILYFKDEFLVQLLKDLYDERAINEIDTTVSDPVPTGTGDTGDVQSDS